MKISDTLKHTRRTACGMLTAGMCIMAAFLSYAAGEGESLNVEKLKSSDDLSTSQPFNLSTFDDLVEEVRELSLKYAALTSAVAFIEHKCETDAAWRKAYHQGEAAQTVATNEFGITYRVTIYKDGYVYADNPRVVPLPASPESAAKAEADRKALIASKVEEARQAMERAVLPSKVADILAERRAAATPVETTVIVEPQRAEAE